MFSDSQIIYATLSTKPIKQQPFCLTKKSGRDTTSCTIEPNYKNLCLRRKSLCKLFELKTCTTYQSLDSPVSKQPIESSTATNRIWMSTEMHQALSKIYSLPFFLSDTELYPQSGPFWGIYWLKEQTTILSWGSERYAHAEIVRHSFAYCSRSYSPLALVFVTIFLELLSKILSALPEQSLDFFLFRFRKLFFVDDM